MKIAVLAAAVVLGFAAPAWAANFPAPPRFHIIAATCPDVGELVGACAFPDGTIYFENGPWQSPWIKAHEIGHVFDFELLSSYDHARFAKMVRIYGDWTMPDVDADGGPAGPLQEDFADAYAACALGLPPSSGSGYGYDPGRRRHRRICAWIRRVAHRASDSVYLSRDTLLRGADEHTAG